MYRNYEKRVKEFVIDMTNPESIIEHKDITEKVTNTRVEFINEQFANNPEKNRPLIFRGYTSEADRIKDVIKKNRFLYYLPDYERIKKEAKRLKALSQKSLGNGSKIMGNDQPLINTQRLLMNNQENSNEIFNNYNEYVEKISKENKETNENIKKNFKVRANIYY